MIDHDDILSLVHEVIFFHEVTVVHEIIVANFISLLELKIGNRWSRKEISEPVIVLNARGCFLCAGLVLCVNPAASKMGWGASGILLWCCWWSNRPTCHRGRLSSGDCELHATPLRGLSGLDCASINVMGTAAVALSKTSSAGSSES